MTFDHRNMHHELSTVQQMNPDELVTSTNMTSLFGLGTPQLSGNFLQLPISASNMGTREIGVQASTLLNHKPDTTSRYNRRQFLYWSTCSHVHYFGVPGDEFASTNPIQSDSRMIRMCLSLAEKAFRQQIVKQICCISSSPCFDVSS